jgi:hypothetical protein
MILVLPPRGRDRQSEQTGAMPPDDGLRFDKEEDI